MIFTDFKQIPLLKYDLIMADPPWHIELYSENGEAKAPQAQYKTMALHEIMALDVGHLASRDCVLWLWAINPMLPQAIQVLEAWGFTFKTAGHWSKKTKTGKQAFGTGYILRAAGEPFLIGTMGQPDYKAKNVRSVIEAEVGRHSAKPDLAFKEAARLVGDQAWKLELFSRQERDGWDVFGNEVQSLK